jgi:hypothetical protein
MDRRRILLEDNSPTTLPDLGLQTEMERLLARHDAYGLYEALDCLRWDYRNNKLEIRHGRRFLSLLTFDRCFSAQIGRLSRVVYESGDRVNILRTEGYVDLNDPDTGEPQVTFTGPRFPLIIMGILRPVDRERCTTPC